MSNENFNDVKEFGESIGVQDSQLKDIDSPYALIIEDVDRQEDRDLIYKVLSESGVDLDLGAVKKQLLEGHLLVTHLNEAKGAILVDQIKDIEAEIKFGHMKELRPKAEVPASEDVSTVEETPEEELTGKVILTTAPSVQGKNVKKYLGLVSAEISLPESAVLEEIERDEEGTGKTPYDLCVDKITNVLKIKALKMKADAVIAVSFDFRILEEKQAFLIFATGTAVTL